MPLSGQWTKLATEDALKRSSHSVSTLDNTAYIFGGELQPRQPRDNALHTLPGLATSTTNSPAAAVTTLPTPSTAPSPRVGSASAALGGRLYLFSGRGGEAMDCIDEAGGVWCFDPSTKEQWSLIKPSDPNAAVPEPRSYHAMIADASANCLYVHAGCPAQGRRNDLWRFDLESKSWKELATAPGKPRGGTSIALAEGKVWRMNGFDGEHEVGGALDVYDPSADSWETVSFEADGKSGPGARSVASLLPVVVKGRKGLLTLFGESDPSSLGHKGAGKMLGDVWVWDFEGRKWQEVQVGEGEKPEGRGWFDADVFGGVDGVVVVGGLGESNDRLDDAWVLSL